MLASSTLICCLFSLLEDYLICGGAHINNDMYVTKGNACLYIPVNHSKSAVEIPKLHSFHREADPRLALHMLCMHLKCIQAYVLWQLILMSIFCYYLLLIVVKALCIPARYKVTKGENKVSQCQGSSRTRRERKHPENVVMP